VNPASERVRAAVAAALPPGYGAITHWVGPRQGDWSWMFEVETGGVGPASLLVKVPRWDDANDLLSALEQGPQAATEEEYRALETIAAAVASSGDPGLTAVVPVTYARAVNAVVTERLRAVTLHHWLRRRGRVETADLFGRVGRWLRVFHATSTQEVKPFGTAEAAEIEQLGGPGGSRRLGDAISAVAGAARNLATRPVATGVLHGDFSMRNVLVTIDDRVAVVDPNRHRGRITRDVAHLLTEVRLGRRQLVTSGAFRKRSTVEGWADSVTAAYPEIDSALLSYERAAAAVKRWADVEARMKGISRVTLLPAGRLFRSEVDALLRTI
jgi:streptomycin 6-kinase